MAERKPAFWAVLPARVRYDPELRPNAKLLYAEITAMADATGYCWASNAYLAELFAISPRTVRELVQSLERKGYLSVEVIRDPGTNAVVERRIWVDRPAIVEGPEATPSGENPPYPSGENPPYPSGENPPDPSGENPPLEQSKDMNIPPIVPQRGRRTKGPKKPKAAPDWKPDRFAAFWDYYPRGESKQAAIRAWDNLKPDDDLLTVMGRALAIQKASKMWQDGIGIPYASTWLNQRRWTEVDLNPGPGGPPEGPQPLRGEGVRYL